MDYVDRIIYHEIMLIFLSNRYSSDIIDGYEDAVKKIKELVSLQQSISTKKNIKELLSSIKSIISKYCQTLNDELYNIAEVLIDKESEWYSKLVKETSGKDVNIPKSIAKTVSLMPYIVTDSIKTFTDKFENKLNNTCYSVLTAGLYLEQPVEQVYSNIDKSLKTAGNTLSSETQTIVKSVADNTRKTIDKHNSKIFTGYKWCAILDSRTCEACEDLDGTVYDLIGDAPYSPLHYRCRCSLVSFMQEISEPEWTTFGDWINKQPEDIQKKVLGKKRYDLWKSGELTVTDFVNNGQKIKLKELYK